MNKQLLVSTSKRVELNEIRQRKADVLNEINLQKDVIVYSAQKIFSPFMPSSDNENNESGSLIKKFNTSLIIFDGIMIGYKVIKNIKRFFKRK